MTPEEQTAFDAMKHALRESHAYVFDMVEYKHNSAVANEHQLVVEIRTALELANKVKPPCNSFGADPDLKPGPLTIEDRGWQPER